MSIHDTNHLDERLVRLGFLPEDRRAVHDLLEQVRAREAWAHEVHRLAEGLRTRVGHVADRRDPMDSLRPLTVEGDVEGGSLLALVALLEVSGEVVAEYVRRGVGRELAWRSLSDLGRQVAICRRVHGVFGLHVPGWVGMGFTGGTLWVGRLQYTLDRCPWDQDRHVLGVHIPDDGPLTPSSVDSSFADALPLARSVYPETEIAGFTCTSWVLDPAWGSRLSPTSNLVAFARRFDLYGEAVDGLRDVLYFVFDVETRYGFQADVSALPRRTALQRSVVDRVTGGEQLLTAAGRIVVEPAVGTEGP